MIMSDPYLASDLAPWPGSLRVYLGGPIGKNDWRHQLVPGLSNAFAENGDQHERARRDVMTELPTITPSVVCVGPWFIGCDHGCAHGRSTHGTEGGGCLADVPGPQFRRDVFDTNLKRLRRADAVFAYFDRKEAYGSAFELGAAHALGKPIYAGFPRRASWQDDMWFPACAGLGQAEGNVGSLQELWQQFCLVIGAGSRLRPAPQKSRKALSANAGVQASEV